MKGIAMNGWSAWFDKKFSAALLLILIGLAVGPLLSGGGPASLADPLPAAPLHLPLTLNGWHGLDKSIASASLNLIQPDSYVLREYVQGARHVDVYVGYYTSVERSDRSHSPLVCYPGQGWTIQSSQPRSLALCGTSVDFEQLVLEKGPVRHLVLYGYLSGERLYRQFYRFRCHLVKNRLLGRPTANALLRFSVVLGAGGEAEALHSVSAFIENSYPYLQRFVASAALAR